MPDIKMEDTQKDREALWPRQTKDLYDIPD